MRGGSRRKQCSGEPCYLVRVVSSSILALTKVLDALLLENIIKGMSGSIRPSPQLRFFRCPVVEED